MSYSLFITKNKKKLAIAILAFIVLFICQKAFAVDVNRNELESTQGSVIVFENYSGPHSKIETVDSIKKIGKNLGEKTKASLDKSSQFDKGAKYSVIHIVDPQENGKLDADIFILNENAAVDHIKNLRRIIAAYLTEAYGYEEKDATTLATFITVYNAVYRGNLDTFNEKYKTKVVENLTKDKCGLSTKWTEWAGKTQIVIPLYDINGGISTVDTTLISDKNVVENMREDDERGIDERKNMVKIKEQESERAQEKAQESAKKAAEASKVLEEEKATLEKDKEEAKVQETKAQTAEKEAQEAKKEAQENPTNSDLKKQADKKEKDAIEARKNADEAKEKVSKQEEKTQNAKKEQDKALEEASKQQSFSDKKLTEAQSERTSISTDQKEVMEEKVKNEQATTVIALILSDKSKLLSSMVKVNVKNGEIMKTSPVKVIRGRTIIAQGANYIAICGENSGNQAIKLCILDGTSMEIIGESEEIIAEDSVLVQNSGNFYCVIQNGKENYIGKFNTNLECLAKSSEKVSANTPITVTSSGLVVTNASGKIIILKEGDLSKATE